MRVYSTVAAERRKNKMKCACCLGLLGMKISMYVCMIKCVCVCRSTSSACCRLCAGMSVASLQRMRISVCHRGEFLLLLFCCVCVIVVR